MDPHRVIETYGRLARAVVDRYFTQSNLPSALDIDDLYQEAYMVLLEQAESLESGGPHSPRLFRLIFGRLMRVYNRSRSILSTPSLTGRQVDSTHRLRAGLRYELNLGSAGGLHPVSQDSPEVSQQRLEDEEALRLVCAAVGQENLDFLLRYLANGSYRELAKAHGLSYRQARRRVRRLMLEAAAACAAGEE